MPYFRSIAFAVAVAMLAAPVAHAAEPAPLALAQVGKWEINYDADACHLIGTFGSETDPVILRASRLSPSSSMRLSLLGEAFRTTALEAVATLDFGPVVNPRKAVALAGNLGTLPLLKLGSFNLLDQKSKLTEDVAITPQQETAVTYLDIGFKTNRYRLQLGPMKRPMDALRTCTADLVKSWGYDAAQQNTLSRNPTPKNSPASWLTTNDYPSAAMVAGQSAVIEFRLDVDEKGRAVDCHVQMQTKGIGFAGETCRKIMSRARFHPALDAAGKPVRWFYLGVARWLLPSD